MPSDTGPVTPCSSPAFSSRSTSSASGGGPPPGVLYEPDLLARRGTPRTTQPHRPDAGAGGSLAGAPGPGRCPLRLRRHPPPGPPRPGPPRPVDPGHERRDRPERQALGLRHRMPQTASRPPAACTPGPGRVCGHGPAMHYKGALRIWRDQQRKHWQRNASTDLEGRTLPSWAWAGRIRDRPDVPRPGDAGDRHERRPRPRRRGPLLRAGASCPRCCRRRSPRD